jgi:hypothetical protein
MSSDLERISFIKGASEFDQARTKAFIESMLAAINRRNLDLLSLEEVVEKLRLKHANYLGLQEIAVAQIAGSAGRYKDFTRSFLPRRKRDKERWRQIYTLATTGKGFPPIEVFKVDQVYFVRDGNHRVSVARALGFETISAYVTELVTPIRLWAEISDKELLIKAECAPFLEITRLDQLCAESSIEFTEPGGYQQLLYHIAAHLYNLRQSIDPLTSFETAVLSWYETVYLPMVKIMRDVKITALFPGRTEGDLYRWFVQHQAELRDQYHLEAVEKHEILAKFLEEIEREEGRPVD